MSDFQNEMNRLVQGFVAEITGLARRAAISTLEAALSNGGRSHKATRSAVVNGSRSRGRGAKRTSAELGKLSENLLEFVKANPGLRVEQINRQLGTSTKDLALPIRKLLAEGALKAKGQKRSTTYFVGEGGRKRTAKN